MKRLMSLRQLIGWESTSHRIQEVGHEVNSSGYSFEQREWRIGSSAAVMTILGTPFAEFDRSVDQFRVICQLI